MTLNQIIAIFKAFADGHKQVNFFGSGELRAANYAELSYPVLWVMHDRSVIGANEVRISFKVALYDLVTADESNVNEVHSDMLEIAKDLISTLNQIEYDEFEDLGEVNGQFVSDKLGDSVAGVQLDLNISMTYTSGTCIIPSDLEITA